MATYRFVANDIRTTLNKQFDDANITLAHAVYWVQMFANKKMFEDIEFKKKDSGLYLSQFSPIPIQIDKTFGDVRKYIDLPASILNLNDDRGVDYLTYNFETGCCCGPLWAQVKFNRTAPRKADILYGDKYTQPSADNPYFYRVADRINSILVDRLYLLGIECIDVTDLEAGLLLSLDPSLVCDLDEQIPLTDEEVADVTLKVLQLGRFASLMPKDNVNEGADQAAPSPIAAPQEEETQTEREE